MLTITTNNVPRDILGAWDLTTAEAEQFDYLDLESGEGSFFRYKGQVYDIGQFVRIVPPGRPDPNPWTHKTFSQDDPLNRWDGICADSYFSALVVRYLVVRYPDDSCESVVVGLATS